jgi:GT2 family glycosyltransferase
MLTEDVDLILIADSVSSDDLKACAEAVAATTRLPHRVLLVTHEALDEADESCLRRLGVDEIVCNPSASNRTALRNLGLSAGRSELVVLLDGRTLTQKGWLEPLVHAARQDERVGVVGGVSVRPGSQEVLQAGVHLAEDLHPLTYCREEFHQFLEPGSVPADPPAVSGHCMLIRRSVADEVGGFDDGYCGFEDVAFCLSVRGAGYQVVLCPESVVWHREPSRIESLPRRLESLERLRNLIQNTTALKNLPRLRGDESTGGGPLVSLLYPAYNDTAFLEQNIESILNQTYRNWELIVIDDASTDATLEILEMYHAAYPDRVKIVHKENHDRFEAWALCYELSRGEYLSILGADDVLLPWCIEEQVRVLEANPSLAFAYSDVYRFDRKGKFIDCVQVDEPSPGRQLAHLMRANYIFTPSVMMRRADVVAAGGWLNREFMYSQDYDLWLRLLHGREQGHVRRPLIKYRIHSAQLTAVIGVKKMRVSGSAVLRDKFARWKPEEFFHPLDLESPKGQAAAYREIGEILFSSQTAACGTQPDVLEFFRELIDRPAKGEKARRAKFALVIGAAFYFRMRWHYMRAAQCLWALFGGAAFEKDLYRMLWRNARGELALGPYRRKTESAPN